MGRLSHANLPSHGRGAVVGDCIYYFGGADANKERCRDLLLLRVGAGGSLAWTRLDHISMGAAAWPAGEPN